jgi:hypothetical protein
MHRCGSGTGNQSGTGPVSIRRCTGYPPGLYHPEHSDRAVGLRRACLIIVPLQGASQHLPRLLDLATSTAHRVAAHQALVVAYRPASSMLLKFNANDIAWLATDCAMHTALVADDTVALARATRSVTAP